jgi:hypothetical protein
MARVETVTCDVCGVSKGVNNHWFIIMSTLSNSIVVDSADRRSIYVDVTDVCGEACVLRKVSELIAKMQVVK